ncbi:hypothetical protein L596_012149 [Steinernema carpocapsae]|uniref:Tubulin--tyrosine ligase-like protein 5 n=1 Tax=Steinernema carpocapsae TaxID=34508 RepID=A0A4U5NW47_STECR|nr:hypothetical protein L596_012149 [Steinernema carpocapsae]
MMIDKETDKAPQLVPARDDHQDHDETMSDDDQEKGVVEASTQRPKMTVPLINFSPFALRCIGMKTKTQLRCRFTKVGEAHHMSFKMNRSETPLIKTLLHAYGFTQCSTVNPDFNLLWTGTHLRADSMRRLAPWQRVNHFPRSYELTRKDSCYLNIERSQKFHGQAAFDFIPEFFITPRNWEVLKETFESEKGAGKAPFIVKPVRSSRGRGISIAENIEQVPDRSDMLVSRYINDPLLVNGHKFDLRIYVVVTSFYPLIVYVYNDGLARFASEKYVNEQGTFGQTFAHLTNYSLNKNSESFEKNKEMKDTEGHKWTLGGLLRHLHAEGLDTEFMMVRIEDIIVKTLISVQGKVAAASRYVLPHPKCCFELFGFDILIDQDLKPWLLEVNLSPSLACDAPLDSVLKTKLICDTFNVACIPLISRKEHTVGTEDSADETEDDLDAGDVDAGNEKDIAKVVPRVGQPVKLPRLRQTAANRIKNRSTNALRKIKQYIIKSEQALEERAKAHVQKVNMETKRKGNFVRVFPRRFSWILYKDLMDYAGSEEWDQKLHKDMFGADLDVINEEVVRRAHLDLMNAKEVKKASQLTEDIKKLIEENLEDAAQYRTEQIFSGGSYLPGLPKIRPNARKRTQSCIDSDELKEENRRQLREQIEQEAAAAKAKTLEEALAAGDQPTA